MSATTARATAPPSIPEAEIDYELVRGEVVPVPPVNYDHRRVVGRLQVRVGSFAEVHDLGDVGPEGGVVLQRDFFSIQNFRHRESQFYEHQGQKHTGSA